MTSTVQGGAPRSSPREVLPPPARPSAVGGEGEGETEWGSGDGPRAEGSEASDDATGALVLTPAHRVSARRPGAEPPLVLRAPLVRPRGGPRPTPPRAGGDGALRALVAEVVRAELGAAVERELAGTLRELVREEVRRALAERGEAQEP